ncbi:MAG TPA: carbon storage regulator [Bryobacteraceae bacterium]|jgi:carbon storage regulator|nr:carbon storage regulator [Bryobacteraceae bacterium]
MLVVRRRAGEGIVVAGDIAIEVIEISRTRVKLGISAPREVPVLRKETVRLREENRQAAALIGERGLAAVEEVLRALRAHVNNP